MNAIFQRRSIRTYTEPDVSDEQIRTILHAAMMAPSANDSRPWQFLVIKEKDRLAQLCDVSPYAKMTKDASVAIIVCGDLSLERSKGFWVQDCSAATQNMLLEATQQGLGAVWLGVYPLEERVEFLRNICQLPQHIVPLCIVPIGHPAQSPETPDRYDATRIHHEIW